MRLTNGKVKTEIGKLFWGHADSAKEQIWQSKLALRWINEVVASFATMEGAEMNGKLNHSLRSQLSP